MHDIHTQNDTLGCITVEYSTLQYNTVQYGRAVRSLRSTSILFSLVWNVQE